MVEAAGAVDSASGAANFRGMAVQEVRTVPSRKTARYMEQYRGYLVLYCLVRGPTGPKPPREGEAFFPGGAPG